MRKVRYNKYGEKDFPNEGWFHQWDNSSQGYTCGIIETPEGLIEEISSYQIKFITSPESEPAVFLPFTMPLNPPSYYKMWELPPTTCNTGAKETK